MAMPHLFRGCPKTPAWFDVQEDQDLLNVEDREEVPGEDHDLPRFPLGSLTTDSAAGESLTVLCAKGVGPIPFS
jgi:hypothetical protein